MCDNYELFRRREAQQERWLKTRPICMECEHPIQEEQCFEMNGEYICESCMNTNHRKYTEDCIS